MAKHVDRSTEWNQYLLCTFYVLDAFGRVVAKHVDRSAEWNPYLLCRLLRIRDFWLSSPAEWNLSGFRRSKLLVSKSMQGSDILL